MIFFNYGVRKNLFWDELELRSSSFGGARGGVLVVSGGVGIGGDFEWYL